MSRRLTIVVCGAGPAGDVDRLVKLAHEDDWQVQIIATPSGLEFINIDVLEALTGNPIRSEYRKPGQPRSIKSDAFIVAPATYNTINKLAAGVSDTYALGALAEAIGLDIPVVVAPFVNSALASRRPFIRSVQDLRTEQVEVLFGQERFVPHKPGEGDRAAESFPWSAALHAATSLSATD